MERWSRLNEPEEDLNELYEISTLGRIRRVRAGKQEKGCVYGPRVYRNGSAELADCAARRYLRRIRSVVTRAFSVEQAEIADRFVRGGFGALRTYRDELREQLALVEAAMRDADDIERRAGLKGRPSWKSLALQEARHLGRALARYPDEPDDVGVTPREKHKRLRQLRALYGPQVEREVEAAGARFP